MATDKPLPPSQTADKYIVRLPDGMRDQIAEAAKAAGRSMNAEIVSRLASSFERSTGAELSNALYRQTLLERGLLALHFKAALLLIPEQVRKKHAEYIDRWSRMAEKASQEADPAVAASRHLLDVTSDGEKL